MLPTFSFSQFKIGSSNSREHYPSPVQFFQYGRDALWTGIKVLDLKQGDEILVPASICSTVLETLIKRGLTIQYYNLTDQLDIDIDDIKSRFGSETRAIYVNHYFGRASAVWVMRKLCDEKGLRLIEDCAHGFLGSWNNKLLGTFGDISIFSYRKFLAVSDGGGLVINDKSVSLKQNILPRQSIKGIIGSMVRMLVVTMAQKNLFPLRALKNINKDNLDKYIDGEEVNLENWSEPKEMQTISKFSLNRSNLSRIKKKRRENYQFWDKLLRPKFSEIIVFNELDKFSIPYSFPICCCPREKLIRLAAAKGLLLEPSLTSPKREIPGLINPKFPFYQLSELASNIISLPVHQSISPRQLEWAGRIILEILNQIRKTH